MKVTLIYFCFAEWDHQHSNNLCCFGKNVNNEKKNQVFSPEKKGSRVAYFHHLKSIQDIFGFWYLVDVFFLSFLQINIKDT